MHNSNAPKSSDIESKIRSLLDELGDEKMSKIYEDLSSLSDERHERISMALEEMQEDIDQLFVRMRVTGDESLKEVDIK